MQQPCSREMMGMNDNNNSNSTSSLLNHSQIPCLAQQDNQLHHHHHHAAQPSHFPHAPPTTDDFLDQMFSSLPTSSWADLSPNILPITEPTATSASADDVGGFHHPPHGLDDQSAVLVSKLRQQQISGGGGGGAPSSSAAAAARALLLQQQLLGHQNDGVFDGLALYNNTNGFGGSSLHGVAGQTSNPQRPHFNHPQGQGGSIQQQVAPNFSAQGGSVTNQGGTAATASTGGAPGQPRQRVRARRGQATDPHSIAERLRRERIAERMKALQELVPNANKTDKASMLDEIIDYVKFLQLQVKVLSMSRLGGAAAVAPLVADVTSEGGGDCNQTSPNGRGNGNTNTNASSSNDGLTVTEHQVAKLMEEDMGSAMQYLQGKGLCLMPISLATAISTATCRSGRPMGNSGVHASNVDGPTSPSMSVLTVQSANNICNGSGNGNGNGGVDVSVKDAASVSKP